VHPYLDFSTSTMLPTPSFGAPPAFLLCGGHSEGDLARGMRSSAGLLLRRRLRGIVGVGLLSSAALAGEEAGPCLGGVQERVVRQDVATALPGGSRVRLLGVTLPPPPARPFRYDPEGPACDIRFFRFSKPLVPLLLRAGLTLGLCFAPLLLWAGLTLGVALGLSFAPLLLRAGLGLGLALGLGLDFGLFFGLFFGVACELVLGVAFGLVIGLPLRLVLEFDLGLVQCCSCLGCRDGLFCHERFEACALVFERERARGMDGVEADLMLATGLLRPQPPARRASVMTAQPPARRVSVLAARAPAFARTLFCGPPGL